jgi:hypothetical protein
MPLKRILSLFILLGSCLAAFPQAGFVRSDSILVTIGSDTLHNAWTGGINFGQFSDIDLNSDGIKDLFVFDRQGINGGRITTFLNKGIPNTVSYFNAPQFVKKFPYLHDWALLSDYNCDGKNDIFTYNLGSVSLYQNTSSLAGGLSFSLAAKDIYSNYGSLPMLKLYVSAADIPAIVDLDGDGDVDIVTYSILGQYAEFHKNFSSDTYNRCDSLNSWVKQTNCYGHYADVSTNCTGYVQQHVASCPVPIPPPNPSSGLKHSGTCLLCRDVNGNKAMDLTIGHVSCTNLTEMQNSGDSSNAAFTTVDYGYPSYDTSINMGVFACGFSLDVDNDGKKDLLVSPNQVGASENFKSVAWYKNVGQHDTIILHYKQNDFLLDNMIDVGEGAYPVLHDYDGDGLADLFIGNTGYMTLTGYVAKIALFKNTGTLNKPQFSLVTRDFAGISALNLGITDFAFTFGDLDGDGDADMVLGTNSGLLYYFEKQAGAPDNYVYQSALLNGLHVGGYSSPQLIDLDRDGQLDLVVGNRSGNLYYFRNTGTKTTPVFSTTATNTKLGGVDTKKTGYVTGYATPFVYDELGQYKMLVGTESGLIYKYGNIDGNLNGNFFRMDTMVSQISEGLRSVPYGYDIDGDGRMDLFVGNYAGGVEYYKGDDFAGIANYEQPASFNFALFPNPASDAFTLSISDFKLSQKYAIRISDVVGRIIYDSPLSDPETQISTSGFGAGVYICSVFTSYGAVHHKLIVRH